MSISEFMKKHKSSDKTPFVERIKKWEIEKDVNDFLGTTIMAGVTLGDIILDGSLRDKIDPDVFESFSSLMNEKADSFEEIRDLIVEKYEISGASVGGLLNKIQGQLGENTFINNVGSHAHLASDGAQKGWDVQIDHGDASQYVQVKIYNDADGVIEKIKEVNGHVDLQGVNETVSQVDFAVNSDIFEEVKEKALALGLKNEILDVGATRDDLRNLLSSNFEDIKNYNGLSNFFGETLGNTLSAGALHAVINGFFVWKGSKEVDQALDDTFHSTSVSAGGIAASMIVEDLLFFGGPVAGLVGLGIGVGTRSVLRRISDRRFLVDRLENANVELSGLLENIKTT